METLIVNYRTEKGEISFVKVPDDASDLTLPKVGMIDLYFKTKVKYEYEEDNYISISLPDVGFKLIGLTSDVTEDQAKMMVDHCNDIVPGLIDGYVDYRRNQLNVAFTNALASFKSLMQHLQVYEVNPYDEARLNMTFSNKHKNRWQQAQERTGQWIVLFKPNEK